jgi:hypothetical protein
MDRVQQERPERLVVRQFRAVTVLEIDIAALACLGATPSQGREPPSTAISSISPIEPGSASPIWRQEGSTLSLSLDAKAFAYRITEEE